MKNYLLRSVSSKKLTDDGGKELKSGFLLKKGKVNKSYKLRWCILRDDKNLYYYRTKDDTRPAGVIDISQAVMVPQSGDSENAFHIITTNRVYYVEASDQDNLEEWIEALNTSSLLRSENEKIEIAEEKISKAAVVRYSVSEWESRYGGVADQ